MQPFLTQFLIKLIFVIGIAISFIQCASDDPSREAATEAALKNPAQPAAPANPNAPTSPARPPIIGKLPMVISSTSAKELSEVCVSVTASQFELIVSMQYTMTWNPSVLQFTRVENFGLPGMTANNFGDRAASKGLLSYSWFDSNVAGITLNDGKKLYDLCFTVIGASGSTSNITFEDKPVVIEISNADSQFLGLDGTNGKVTVE